MFKSTDQHSRSPYPSNGPQIYPQRILVADDHEVVRQGLAHMLQAQYTALKVDFASSYPEVYSMLEQQPYSMLVLDLKMDNNRIFDGIQRLLESYPDNRILIYSAFEEETFAHRLLKMGVYGFVPKSAPMERVREAVVKVMNGEHLVSPRVFRKIMDSRVDDSGNALDELSNRELEIFIMLVGGRTASEIADELFIHTSTVGTYKHRIYAKFGTRNLADLTLIALQHQLLV